MGIWDIFTPDAGQKRRQWLNQNLDTPINKALSYYMGAGNSLPQALGLLADSNPIAGLDRAGTQSQDIFAANKTPMERLISTSNMLSETAGAGLGLLGAPAASKIGADVLTDVATRVSKNAKKAGNNVVESLNQRGPMPTLGSNGGNMFDPTYTGWTFKDVDANLLPAARTDAEAMAKQILELRAAGRSNEVTEAMMAAADNPYMYANTPLDMSQEARMSRASDMGYDMTPMYRGAPNDEISFNPEKYKPTRPYIYSSDNPYIASSYAKNANRAALENSEMTNSPVVAPLLTKRRGILDVDAGGAQYGQIPFDEPVTPNGQTLRQVLGDDARSFNINGVATTNTDLVPYWAIGDNNFNSVEFKNIQDRGNEAYYNYNTKDILLKNGEVYKSVSGTPDTEFMANMKAPSTVRVNRPEDVRSKFARFDPEFSHLRNLTAAIPVGLLGLSESQKPKRKKSKLTSKKTTK